MHSFYLVRGLGETPDEERLFVEQQKILLAEQIKATRWSRVFGVVTAVASVGSIALSVYALTRARRR